MQNKELAEELRKPNIRKFEKRKKHSSFIDNIWGADIADMQLLSKFNKRICFCCVLLIFIVSMLGLFLWKIKNVLQLLTLDDSGGKPNKIWVDKGIVSFTIDQ